MAIRHVLVVLAIVLAAVAAATMAGAATITASAKKLGTATFVAPSFVPSTISTANNGARAGRADRRDTTTISYSQQVKQSTLCSSWSNASTTETLTGVTLTLNDNAGATGNDTLTVGAAPATCASGFHLGTVDTGSNGYATAGNVTYTNSTIALTQTATSTTLVLTFGTVGGTRGTVAAAAAAIYTPDTMIQSVGGQGIGVNQAATITTVQW